MNPNAKDLVNKSIEIENDFSSSSHVIDTLVTEATEPATDYTIPSRYNKDTLRILLVNTKKYYVYWEVSDKTLEEKGIDLNKDQLSFVVKDLNDNELVSFKSSFALGDYFVNLQFENTDIYAKVGIVLDGEFVELISSNNVHTFSSQINLPDEKNDVMIKKTHGWTEVVRTTMEHLTDGVSSAQYIKELERLRHFTEVEEEKIGSSELYEGTKND